MTQSTDTDIRDIKTSIEANTKAISDLTSSVSSLREEIRVEFTSINGKFDTVNARLTNLETNTKAIPDLIEKVTSLNGKIDKLDDRTKLGFWGFILRGLVLTALIGVGTYLLPIVAEYVHKLPIL